MRFRFVLFLCLMLPEAGLATEFTPDAAAVRREGAGYRYPQCGWIVVHVEGGPYERGVQQGKLLSREIQDYVKCFAAQQSPKSPADGWRLTRTLTEALFARRFDPELLEEMKGIADGASAGGARFDARPLDLTDIVAINAWPEIITLDDALRAVPNGLEGKDFDKLTPAIKPTSRTSRCSAFAATGPATKDGKAIIGHITMFDIYPCNFFNVWLDVKPSKGHRVVIQAAPGSVQSGMDWYINDAGMVLTETTIAQTRFNPTGRSIGSRSRMAMQYGDSIDSVVKLLGEHGNGLYTNEWILADMKTDEIAMFELGTNASKLMRSSKDEWFGNTRGFYWGCNNTKDTAVRMETIAAVNDRPADMTFCPEPRDVEWVKLFNENKGRIDAEFGKLAFGKPPLAARNSCDAKYTTSEMARQMKSFGHWGDPYGQLWEPGPDVRRDFPAAQPILPHDWTVLTVNPPARSNEKSQLAVDFRNDETDADEAGGEDKKVQAPAAWHGTLLPASDGDRWLASSFARFHEFVAHEREMRRKHDAKDSDPLSAAERDELAVQLFNLGVATADEGASCASVPLRKLTFDPSSDAPYRSAAGRGVMLLSELRRRLTAEVFDPAMDAFGREHAGKVTTSSAFVAAMTAAARGASGTPSIDRPALAEFFGAWLDSGDYLPALKMSSVQTDHRNGFTVSGSVTSKGGCTPSDVDVTLETESSEITKSFPFDSAGVAHFKFDSESKPARITVNKYFQTPCANVPRWTTSSYKRDLEHTLIVYGTREESEANKIAATKLRQAIINQWQHSVVPVNADVEIADADIQSHHLVLVGRPASSPLIERLSRSLPITFSAQTFTARGKVYAHEQSAVAVAGANPENSALSVVVVAGLSPLATFKAAEALPASPPTAARIFPAGAKAADIIPPGSGLTRALP